MTAEEIKVFEWDDEIEDDGEERSFVTLETGDYDFEVTEFTREQYTPKESSKLPAAPMAVVRLKVSTDEGDAYLSEKFILCSALEWKISSFFRSIGMKKHGEKLVMNWQKTVGEKGRARIVKTPGKDKDVFFNNVKYFIDPPATKKESDDTWS